MNILRFGGGVQTTALAILVAQGKVKVDAVVFADTGAEKPETYWYIEAYIKPLFKEAGIPFTIVPGTQQGRNLPQQCEKYRAIPSVVKGFRWCTAKHKVVPMDKVTPKGAVRLIGFSIDEIERSKSIKGEAAYPLAEMNLTGADCRQIITSYGWPVPVKSSCFFCPFQRWPEWNWLKSRHPELMDKALAMEARFYDRRPDLRETRGLFGGAPLWKYAQGIQMEMPILKEYSCWSGACGH